MKHATTWTAAVLASALTGCGGSSGDGLRLDPLPSNLAAPCPHPASLLSRGGTVADDEISLGRVGEALIDCGQAKAAIVAAYNGVRADIASE